MLQLTFRSIQEEKPGTKWQKLFQTHWNAYKNWFQSKGAFQKTSLQESREALKKYMPEFYNTYSKLCELAGNSKEAQRFLTGYNPPAYISGCSQLVFAKNPQLVRNYDYHPHLSEGSLLMTEWHDKKVIAVGDCLWGAVDGMNENGITISLTYGGRKAIGEGFGIPFIIRYALEFSNTVEQAVSHLTTIPSHMAYNVAVMDKKGNHKMVMLSPDKEAVILDSSLSTNHQGAIDWPEHAAFSKTLEREQFLKELFKKKDLSQEKIVKAFLSEPLFSKRYNEGFGTVYTAIYRPTDGYVELRWQNQSLVQSFEDFKENELLISYEEVAYKAPIYERPENVPAEQNEFDWSSYVSGVPEKFSNSLELMIESMKYLPNFDETIIKEKLSGLSADTKKRGDIPWEMLAEFWLEFGKSFY